MKNISAFFRKIRFKKRRKYCKKQCKNIDSSVSLISSNCWGGFLYHDMGLQFLTPTINLTFSPEDYIFFCENLDSLQSVELYEDKSEHLNYPVGVLCYPKLSKSIKIHFVHYKTFNEAKCTFLKRVPRINPNNIVCLFNVMNLKKEIAEKFSNIKAKKKICVYINYENEDNPSSTNNCLFFKLGSTIPKGRDMLSFKSILGRKMYIDDINFCFYKYIFDTN